jgi:hypothetical protein
VSAILTLCGGFLLAVLWMDLMFDVQVLRYRDTTRDLPEDVLSSIATYYRRVTTEARPMNRAIGGVMLVLGLTLMAQIIGSVEQRWVGVASSPFCGAPILLAGLRVVPNAARLGSRADVVSEQSRLARAICRDHLLCLAGIVVFLALQLIAAWW